MIPFQCFLSRMGDGPPPGARPAPLAKLETAAGQQPGQRDGAAGTAEEAAVPAPVSAEWKQLAGTRARPNQRLLTGLCRQLWPGRPYLLPVLPTPPQSRQGP